MLAAACGREAPPAVAVVEVRDAGAASPSASSSSSSLPVPTCLVTPDDGHPTNAQKELARGDELAEHGCLDDAQRSYERVVKFFPYSSLAKVAELRLAELDSRRGDWSRAVDRYDAWLRAHPTAPEDLVRQAKAGSETARCRGSGRADCD